MTIDVNNPKPISHLISPREAQLLDDTHFCSGASGILCLPKARPNHIGMPEKIDALGKFITPDASTLETRCLGGKALFQIAI
jgi:hypothetical protein